MFADTKTQSADLQLKQAVTPALEDVYARSGEIRESFVSQIGKKIDRGEITARDVYESKLGLDRSINAIPVESKLTTEVASSTPPPQYKSNHRQSGLDALARKSSLARFALDKTWS